MASTIIAKQYGVDNYEWLVLDNKLGAAANNNSDELQLSVGDGERLQEQVAQGSALILLAPAEMVALKRADFDDGERKLLRQTIPYTLEDDCVDDVDDVHFALGVPADNSVPLAIIKRGQLQQLIADAEQQQLEVQQLVSELTFLPLPEQGWCLYIEGDRWLLRAGEQQGFALDAATASIALQLLLEEIDFLPEQLWVFTDLENQVAVTNQLPELLRGICQWRDQDYWQVVAEAVSQQSSVSGINLLQGDFARQLPWGKWWVSWRIPAILLAAGFVFAIVTSYAQISLLEQRNVELRAAIESSYRSVVPRGAVMDAERQLRRKVGELKGSDGIGFIALMGQISPVLTAVDGLVLQSLNYNEKQSEFRLTILANDFNDVETTRYNLEKLGLTAELTGSNNQGEKTRARLRVRD
ncbi:MAG: type II secretion system protein L [Oceanicoccus sp.]